MGADDNAKDAVRDEDGQEVVRIISARRATLKERKEYEQNRSI